MFRLAVLLLPLVVKVPAGTYRPLYSMAGVDRVKVAAFALDRAEVTRRDFLTFVTTHPAWRRDAVKATVADGGYLADWRTPLDAGGDLDAPVTRVSWFAAKAYCEAQGKRLPTVDEWEYVAAASATKRDASSEPAFRNQLLTLYATRARRTSLPSRATEVNAYGVRNLHGAVWEWTFDFAHMHGHEMSCAGASMSATDPSNYPAFMRAAVRASLTQRSTTSNLGFRCAV